MPVLPGPGPDQRSGCSSGFRARMCSVSFNGSAFSEMLIEPSLLVQAKPTRSLPVVAGITAGFKDRSGDVVGFLSVLYWSQVSVGFWDDETQRQMLRKSSTRPTATHNQEWERKETPGYARVLWAH